MLHRKGLVCSLLVLLLVAPSGAAAEESLEQRYAPMAERIRVAALEGNGAYAKLTELCVRIGHRLSGSVALERAIEWAVRELKADGHENVHTEKVMVPRWVRGSESLEMVRPRAQRMTLLGLGGSVGTPPDGITADLVVVDDEQGLEAVGDAARGKIVLFNNAMPDFHPFHGTHYGTTVRFRVNGATLVAKHGAVAVLIRSVTARSLYTPHTGAMRYGEEGVKVPAAAITTEDANLFAEMQARGERITVTLKMGAKDHGLVPSANVVAELRGTEKPDEIVIISGHLDSWDVGHGAHDDGSGCVMAMEALTLLRKLDLRPRRTIRVVLWTNEENGFGGARQYARDHADELARHVAAVEADTGSFQPEGFSIDLQDKVRSAVAVAKLAEILRLLAPIAATRAQAGWAGADLLPMREAAFPLLGLRMDISSYFDYHHTPADTIDKIDPALLTRNVIAMATLAYVLADMPGRLDDLP